MHYPHVRVKKGFHLRRNAGLSLCLYWYLLSIVYNVAGSQGIAMNVSNTLQCKAAKSELAFELSGGSKLIQLYNESTKVAGTPSLNNCLQNNQSLTSSSSIVWWGSEHSKLPLLLTLRRHFYKSQWINVLMTTLVPMGERHFLTSFWPESLQGYTCVAFGCLLAHSCWMQVRHDRENCSASNHDIISCLLESIYVEDIVGGAETKQKAIKFYQTSKEIFPEEKAIKFYETFKEIFPKASFNVWKFCINSTSLQRQIDCIEKQHCPKISELPVARSQIQCLEELYVETTLWDSHPVGPEEQKVLGMHWRTNEDMLVFDVSAICQLAEKWESTKSNVINIKEKFFDPLNFFLWWLSVLQSSSSSCAATTLTWTNFFQLSTH